MPLVKNQATALPAATVLLLRDTDQGPEVFMVARHHQIEAFSGALVFPGGKVDPQDDDPALAEHCRTPVGQPPLAYWIAAVREAFEESGVLLARRRDGGPINQQTLAGERERLCAGGQDLLALCRRHQLQLTLDRLTPFARWITPKVRPQQFDTWFFLAPLPAGQNARHDGGENLDSMWIRPAEAIERARAGQLPLVFPTRMNLARLARPQHADVNAVLRAAAGEPVVAVQPEVQPHPDGRIMTIPGDAGYGPTRWLISTDGRRLEPV